MQTDKISEIDLGRCVGWTTSNGVSTPDAIGAECPSCGHVVSFRLRGYETGRRHSYAVETQCPHCSAGVSVILVMGTSESEKPLHPSAAFISPGYGNRFEKPMYDSDVPAALARAIAATVDAYNAQIYPAAAVQGRRALEGVFTYLVPENMRHRTLAVLIDEVKKKNDLASTLTSLSHSIRKGGNLGAHFDSEREPDEKMARAILELLLYLVSYLYILPKRIKFLEEQLVFAT